MHPESIRYLVSQQQSILLRASLLYAWLHEGPEELRWGESAGVEGVG